MDKFVKVYEIKISEDVDCFDPIFLVYDHVSLCIIDVKDYKKNMSTRVINRNPNIPHVNITIINDLLLQNFTNTTKILIYPFEFDNIHINTRDDFNFRNFNRFLNDPNDITIIIKLNKKINLDKTCDYFLEYYVNKNCITNMLNGRKVTDENMIINIFEKIQEKKYINECDSELNNILNNTVLN